VTLEDRYVRESGAVLLSGTQALVRLLFDQRRRDAAAGLDTAGFVSGYRGSPLGGLDIQLWRERERLCSARIHFEPGVNEDLAATAVWGSQQAPLLPEVSVAGVFALWYGKGPGVDRAGDAIKHGNRHGTSRNGGVLVVFGDDHPGKSSTISHQSEQALGANGVPVLYPASVQEYLDLGLHGYALSRHAGTWVGLKCVNETVETTSVVEVTPGRILCRIPSSSASDANDIHGRLAFDPLGDEKRHVRQRLPRVHAYVRENALDRITHGRSVHGVAATLGIVAAGKSWLDVIEALDALGLDAARLATLGIAVYKPALIWPLEPIALTDFAKSRAELLFVEEKAAFLEPQAAHDLYNLSANQRPRIVGKHDECGAPLLPSDVPLEPLEIARVIGLRLRRLEKWDSALEKRLKCVERDLQDAHARVAGPTTRTPYFCSGCPHNSSTRLPEGSLGMAGIGCHTMAIGMNRRTLPPTQMGGEGLNWVGIAPFTGLRHVFQNLGDGTYFHSGLLAIRGAVTAGVNITYKILVNDAVAMTGGQPVEGHLSIAELSHQLRAERVQRIAVVSDDVTKYGPAPPFAAGVTVHHRSALDVVQRELRETPGVSALLYDQTCAAEKRRRRKRGRLPVPGRRILINELVCEGCGDCSTASNCVSIEPRETEFGRKRMIDQSSCNQDYSCADGFCPAFVSVRGATLRRETPTDIEAALVGLPDPQPFVGVPRMSVLITGIGGTGVVTVGAVLAMAAHLDGLAASVFDMTGLAQKGGAVLSHLKFAARPAELAAPRVGMLAADVILGCDLVVTASAEVLRSMNPERTRAVVNSHLVPTAAFQANPDVDLRAAELHEAIARSLGSREAERIDSTQAATTLLGDAVAANLLLVGFALQRGWLPISASAIGRAIELNGTAVELNRGALQLGRLAAYAPERLARLIQEAGAARRVTSLLKIADGEGATEARIQVREAFLAEYQDQAYAQRYRSLIDRVATREQKVVSGSEVLTDAVARGYFKLLAYKDEYEVARLHATTLLGQVAATFSGAAKLSFHLAPPGIARADPQTGQIRKIEVGSWSLPLLRLLAKFKFLRGSVFDPFGYAAQRKMERRLITEYEQLVEHMAQTLRPERLDLAVELASLPDGIRGFGHVKDRHVAAVKKREAELRQQWDLGSSA
jgi:indolepyruvate ferredoxin oxidoreductase